MINKHDQTCQHTVQVYTYIQYTYLWTYMCVYTNTPNMHVYTYILYTIYVYACVPLYLFILYVQYLQFVIIIQYKKCFEN